MHTVFPVQPPLDALSVLQKHAADKFSEWVFDMVQVHNGDGRQPSIHQRQLIINIFIIFNSFKSSKRLELMQFFI